MNRKRLIIILIVVLIGFIIYHFIDKSNLMNEMSQNYKEVEEMVLAEESVHLDAGETAENFILSYFNFEGAPKEDKVKKYLSEDVLNGLNFKSSDGYDNDLSEIKSTVHGLEIYFGKAVDDKQKVLAVFENELDISNQMSTTDSYVEMNLEKNNEDWIITDFHFFQY